jgi:hypothetical protein
VDKPAEQAALAAFGHRLRNGLRGGRIGKQSQRHQRHPLQADAGMARRAISCQASGAAAVNQSIWVRK